MDACQDVECLGDGCLCSRKRYVCVSLGMNWVDLLMADFGVIESRGRTLSEVFGYSGARCAKSIDGVIVGSGMSTDLQWGCRLFRGV